MKKLIEGVRQFQKSRKEEHIKKYSGFKTSQSPRVMMIACADSRVDPEYYTCSGPGEFFSIYNVGNIVPIDSSEYNSVHSAIEFAVDNFAIEAVIICGHSNCGAMGALHAGVANLAESSLKKWLNNADGIEEKWNQEKPNLNSQKEWSEVDRLSQFNVTQQLERLKNVEKIKQHMQSNDGATGFEVVAWWIDVGEGDVYQFDETQKQFLKI